jgi:hypothetical protein
MDPSSDLPPGLKPPAGGDLLTVSWRTDIGSNTRLGDIAAYMQDLGDAVDLGERWGAELAREAGFQRFLIRVRREGPRAIDNAAHQLGYSQRDIDQLQEWVHFGWPPEPRGRHRLAYGWDAGRLLEAAGDMELPRMLGRGTRVESASYSNPLEVVLGGSGLSLLGVTYVLRLIRDWSNERRKGAAQAEEAEAAAREHQAQADECRARADYARWLVDETKAGRIPIPPGDLLRVVTNDDMATLDRLVRRSVELELPEQLDPSRVKRPR